MAGFDSSGEAIVAKQFLVECVPHVAWGVFCSTNVRLPEWVDDQQGNRIPVFFRLLSEGDDRAISFIDEVAASTESGECADECCRTWQVLMAALKSDGRGQSEKGGDMKLNLEFFKTWRGDTCIKFVDTLGSLCSIEESTDFLPSVWFGTGGALESQRFGEEGTRMHLSQEQVAELLPLLQWFVKTGELPKARS